MRRNQRVAEMANEVLARQARERVGRTGEPFDQALETVLGTEAGQRLEDLRVGEHGEERAQAWQEGLAEERAEERREVRQRRRGQRG